MFSGNIPAVTVAIGNRRARMDRRQFDRAWLQRPDHINAGLSLRLKNIQ